LHRIAYVKTRHHRTFGANKSIWRPSCAQASDRAVARLCRRNRPFGVNRQRQTAALHRVSGACRRPLARAELVYASARAFVIRCPLANAVSPIPR
jgi:hypothetical protein